MFTNLTQHRSTQLSRHIVRLSVCGMAFSLFSVIVLGGYLHTTAGDTASAASDSVTRNVSSPQTKTTGFTPEERRKQRETTHEEHIQDVKKWADSLPMQATAECPTKNKVLINCYLIVPDDYPWEKLPDVMAMWRADGPIDRVRFRHVPRIIVRGDYGFGVSSDPEVDLAQMNNIRSGRFASFPGQVVTWQEAIDHSYKYVRKTMFSHANTEDMLTVLRTWNANSDAGDVVILESAKFLNKWHKPYTQESLDIVWSFSIGHKNGPLNASLEAFLTVAADMDLSPAEIVGSRRRIAVHDHSSANYDWPVVYGYFKEPARLLEFVKKYANSMPPNSLPLRFQTPDFSVNTVDISHCEAEAVQLLNTQDVNHVAINSDSCVIELRNKRRADEVQEWLNQRGVAKRWQVTTLS